MRLIIVVLLMPALFFAGCSAGHQALKKEPGASEYGKRVDALRHDLLSLGSEVEEHEAVKAAETAIAYPLALADEYRLVSPPVFHNLLINLGMKDRGLCIHWTEDLLKRLRSLGLKSLELHWGIAEPESLFGLQHSSVIITARGAGFHEGLVLDAWRNSGELYWIKVKGDSYAWQPESALFNNKEPMKK